MIEIQCPKCQKKYRLDDKFAGKKAKCKNCGQILRVRSAVLEPESTAIPDAVPIAEAVPISDAFGFDDTIPVAEAIPDDPPQSFAAAPSPATDSGDLAGTGENLRGTTDRLAYEVSQRPDFSIVNVNLPHGGKVFAEPSAMVSMTPSMHLEAGFKGGLGKTFGRMLGGESLIINTFTAQNGPGEIMFAGGAAGDVAYHRLNDSTLYLQRGAYMFNSEGVEVSGKWQGAKGFFSGEGLVLLKASGTGDLFFNSYGAIIPIDVTEGFIVDTGYIVAFEDSLEYSVTVLPGLRMGGKIKSFFFGGEGLVCQFAGSGRVWVQTRQAKSFLSWVNAFRPAKSK